ncbi:hypothetical protein F0562_032576 [Nyssa sinensis]|uniref:Uncharacterized protein n=1 Tax=Nyssa sinensis TaxID=561372 RepID=A0A5J5AQU9_9ASTE|nr:hypothetical protein F0562_032576 [Nyssa sinensis]
MGGGKGSSGGGGGKGSGGSGGTGSGGGNGSLGGGSGAKGGGSGGGSGMMKAPGEDGSYISRPGFESNPQGYFAGLHGTEKGNNASQTVFAVSKPTTRPSVSSESVPIIHPQRRRFAFRHMMYASVIFGAEVSAFGVVLESGRVYLGGAESSLVR